MRVENPLFTHVLFPVYMGLLLWGALYLRDARLRALLPWRSSDERVAGSHEEPSALHQGAPR